MVASGIFYRLGENHRPVNSLEQKIWMKLYSLPFFNRVRFVKKIYAELLNYLFYHYE